MTQLLPFFAPAPRGLTSVLVEELEALDLEVVREHPAGVEFRGNLLAGYRACLWSRVASRVLLKLDGFPVRNPDDLYAGVRQTDWATHLAPHGSLAVDFTGTGAGIRNTRFGALKVKDAVADQFLERFGRRPSVNTERPDVRIRAHLHRNHIDLYLDLAGEPLHRRGYRKSQVAAPLKENLAAAILLRSGWARIAREGGGLYDPMCGSGTLLIEGAMIAADVAPGLQRRRFGFMGWKQHRPADWQSLMEEARTRREAGLAHLPPIVGTDRSLKSVNAARDCVEAAGLSEHITVRRGAVEAEGRPSELADLDRGLVVTNPPYGERLGEVKTLADLYRSLGNRLLQDFSGWKAGVFTGNPQLGRDIGLRAVRSHRMYNGPIECRLLRFDIEQRHVVKPPEKGPPTGKTVIGDRLEALREQEGTRMVANRLRKNLKAREKWARKAGVSCFRVYDADMPEYAVAIDIYQSDQQWAVLQEYAPPAKVDRQKARARLREAVAGTLEVLDIPPERLVIKQRRRQKGRNQYDRLGEKGAFMEVREGPARLLVNLTDYLDTGLFLDHRLTRQRVMEMARGRDFLNLFAYTGSVSVFAALGGAKSTTTVDMSRTYLDWARRNMALNGFEAGAAHRFVRADCLQWLEEQGSGKGSGRYGLIFLDPPTFSTSKRMEQTFDVQRDHVTLLRQTARLLTDDGVLVFSNNLRSFRMDTEALPELEIEDITRATIPEDFKRNPRIHNCWLIRKRG